MAIGRRFAVSICFVTLVSLRHSILVLIYLHCFSVASFLIQNGLKAIRNVWK